jgi:hypothetical protein
MQSVGGWWNDLLLEVCFAKLLLSLSFNLCSHKEG